MFIYLQKEPFPTSEWIVFSLSLPSLLTSVRVISQYNTVEPLSGMLCTAVTSIIAASEESPCRIYGPILT